MVSDDLDTVRTLLVELAVHLGEKFDVDEEDLAWNLRQILSRPDEYASFVCETDPTEMETVVGFVSMVFYRSLFHRNGTALVNELVVAQSYRRRGIGTELIGRAFEEARLRGMDEIEVGALKENIDAISFYRRVGFDEEYVLLGHEFD